MSGSSTIPLRLIAHARGGDKGRLANVGVVARSEGAYRWIGDHVTEDRVMEYFASLRLSGVRRYALPRVLAYNYVLKDALAGGASGSLRIDSQGKALGVALLELRLPAPPWLRDREMSD